MNFSNNSAIRAGVTTMSEKSDDKSESPNERKDKESALSPGLQAIVNAAQRELDKGNAAIYLALLHMEATK